MSRSTRSGGSYEYDWKASSLQASGSMNCSSARYAFAFLTGKAQSRGWYALRAANDGYVTWHRTRLTSLSGPDGGCGTWVSNLTYSEFSSGTAMRFRLVESGC